ncbi:MAG: hypothetical protein ABL940_04535 [Bacteroidia bacterium]
MRTIYSHLQAVKSIGEDVLLAQKPTFRSSAIFPVLHNAHYSSKIIFMGYWLLKRKIKEIGLLYTLRSATGQIIARKYILINTAKAFSIQLDEFELPADLDFKGSLELEIFSTQDLVYPYPAFVLVYFGDDFSTAVHSVGRLYNDIEDLAKNEEYKVRETGFDIYGRDNLSPFVAFTNGTMPNEHPTFTYEINNAQQHTTKDTFSIAPLQPFETVFLKLKEHINLKQLLGNDAGAIKLGHNLEGFFPRFAVGNFEEKTNTISITHSYYDNSTVNDAAAFWNRKDELFNDSSVSIPLYITNNYYTRIAIYPIFSPSDFHLSYSFYDADGNLLKTLTNYTLIKSSDDKYEQIDFKTIALAEGIDSTVATTVNLICNWNDKSKIPTRIKFGLNVGVENNLEKLPCNICFAPQLGNPNVLKKQGTFRWAPFVNVGTSEIVFTNSASLKEYATTANVTLNFYREQDDTAITRTIKIAPNAIKNINLATDKELADFFNQQSGWVTAQADTPFLNGYYFDFFNNGAIAADHIF